MDTPAPQTATAEHRPFLVRAARNVWQAMVRLDSTMSRPGQFFAIVFFGLSQTPSLIPRSWLFQGLLSGISVAVGYMVGVFGAWVVRKVGIELNWPGLLRRRVGQALFILAGISAPVMLGFGQHWQEGLRAAFGITDNPPTHALNVLAITVLLSALLILVFRELGHAVARLAVLLDRFLPLQLARIIALVAVAAVTVMLVNGTVVRGALWTMEKSNSAKDLTTDVGVSQPTSPLRSGSDASAASWDSLGRQGRNFVSGGPSIDTLRNFAERSSSLDPDDVMEPIRVYAGLRTADSLDQIAQVVVDELDRTDAWDRDILAVATTTGTGWVDAGFSDALEYMHGGNSAIAAMQYSYLPSWVSFLSDRATPEAAGKALFEAVYERWSQLPEDSRPYLLVFGLSLGSYGAQAAFGGLQDLAERTDGALFVGTPSFTPLWSSLTAGRDRGSLEVSPIVDGGEQVRWFTNPNNPDQLWQLGEDNWTGQRTVYVQHASDAVVWWNTELLWSQPDWISEPPGPDRFADMFWVPLLTFWQVSFDQFVAGSAPPGHGHTYVTEYVAPLAALGGPEGWTTEATTLLGDVLLAENDTGSSSLLPEAPNDAVTLPSASPTPSPSN